MTGIRFGFMAATLAALAALTPVTATQAAETCTDTAEGGPYRCADWIAVRTTDEMTDKTNWTTITTLRNTGLKETWPALAVICMRSEPIVFVHPGTYVLPPYEVTFRVDAAQAETLPYQNSQGTAAAITDTEAIALTGKLSAGSIARVRLNTVSGLETFTFPLNGFSDALALTPCKP